MSQADAAAQEKKGSDDEMPELENQDAKNLNRGEKKCRKALLKLGMKQFDGVTRVTLRKRDGMICVVNDPQVLRSENNGNSFAVLGELSFDDPSKRLQAAESQKYAEAQR